MKFPLLFRARRVPGLIAVLLASAAAAQSGPANNPAISNSSGGVVLAGSRVAAGSSVTAGTESAVLSLRRGGEVKVCPGTTISVTSSQNGSALMLGMSTGALEAHYNLEASADSILTPDFRILMAGPGAFHFAVSSDSRGNTCIQALPGNTASVIVSELLGDGTYQVKPNQQITFRSGRLNLVDAVTPASCGCPPPAPVVLRSSAPPPLPEAKPASSGQALQSASLPGNVENPSETAALPASKPDDIHIQVEAPFVFRGDDPQAGDFRIKDPAPSVRLVALPAPSREIELLPVSSVPRPASIQIAALPPAPKPAHHGFFGKIKGFFVTVFG